MLRACHNVSVVFSQRRPIYNNQERPLATELPPSFTSRSIVVCLPHVPSGVNETKHVWSSDVKCINSSAAKQLRPGRTDC